MTFMSFKVSCVTAAGNIIPVASFQQLKPMTFAVCC